MTLPNRQSLRVHLRPHGLLILLVAIFIILGAYYSFTTSIFETPDEIWHYQFVREVAVNHGLPVVNPAIQQTFAHEGLQPPLYYTLGAPLIAWMDPRELAQVPAQNPDALIGEPAFATNDNRNAFLHSADETFPYHGVALAVHLLRLYSVLLGAATVVLTYLLALECLTPEGREPRTAPARRDVPPARLPEALLAAAFVAFLPQFLFISGAISNDNLTTLLSALALWQLARTLRLGLTNRRAMILGVVVAGAALSKLSAAALAPLVLLVFAYLTWRQRTWRTGIVSSLLFLAMLVVLAGWWYVRNWLLYGEIVPFTALAALVGARPVPLNLVQWIVAEGEGLRLSTWGVFGWFNILMATWFYEFYDALAFLGLAGMAYALARRKQLSLTLLVFPIWIIVCVIALWRYSAMIVSSQGRLLFPALPAWAVLWAWGLSALVPLRFQTWTKGVVGGALFASAALAPLLFIVPAYTPSTFVEQQLPSNLTRLDWHFENGIDWLGASLDRATVRPGQELTVTIYQRVPSAAAAHQALFIHLVNSADVIVAQRDSLIGSGNLAGLNFPAQLADTYRLSIPVTAPDINAGAWQIEAGLYDPAGGQRLRANHAGQALSDRLILAQVHVDPPAARAWHYDFGGQATLVGAEYDRASVRAGNTLALTLDWQGVNSTRPYHVFVHALGDQNHIWAAADMPIDNSQPSQAELRFDPATPAGIYPLEVGVYAAPDGNRLGVFDAQGQDAGDHIFLGPIRVTR